MHIGREVGGSIPAAIMFFHKKPATLICLVKSIYETLPLKSLYKPKNHKTKQSSLVNQKILH